MNGIYNRVLFMVFSVQKLKEICVCQNKTTGEHQNLENSKCGYLNFSKKGIFYFQVLLYDAKIHNMNSTFNQNDSESPYFVTKLVLIRFNQDVIVVWFKDQKIQRGQGTLNKIFNISTQIYCYLECKQIKSFKLLIIKIGNNCD